MNIWLLIWLAITAALLYFFAWTIFILYKQKQTWRTYAEKMKLRYTPGKMQESPEINGNYRDYTVSMFTGDHTTADMRGVRKLSAVEVQLMSKMPFEGGVASRGMVEFLKGLAFKDEILPKHPRWKTEYIAASNTPYALQSYLTDARIEALSSLMRVKNAWVIMVFKNDMALLRFDTPDPLETEKKITVIVDRMIEVAKILELEQGEAARLKEDTLRTAPRQATIHIKDENVDVSSLELEEDTKPSPQSQTNKEQLDENGNE